jgi:hypothetical protein
MRASLVVLAILLALPVTVFALSEGVQQDSAALARAAR